MMMDPQQAKELTDSYKERQQKYEQKLFVRMKRYFQKRKEEKRIQRKMNDYMSKIKYAALHGNYSIHIIEYISDDFRLDKMCLKKLQEIGYEVNHMVYNNHAIEYIISWDKGE